MMIESNKNRMETFAGLNISPCNAMWDGSKFVIPYDDWNHSSYNSLTGLVSGSYYFGYNHLGQYFDSRGSEAFAPGSTPSNIDNNGRKTSYGGFDDWRVPTKSEWDSILLNTNRVGASINGVANRRFAFIKLTGVTYAGSSTPFGVLLAPDYVTMTGQKSLNWNTASTSGNTNVTVTELNRFIQQGCVFLPSSGWYYPSSGGWATGGAGALLLSATCSKGTNVYTPYFRDNGTLRWAENSWWGSNNEGISMSVRLVRTA